MNCPKCNSIINQGESFCKVCGYNLNQNQQLQQSNYNQVPTWDWNVNPTLQNNNNNNTLSTNFTNQTTNQTIQQNYSAQNNNQAITRNINSSSSNSSIIENSNLQNNSIIQPNNQVNIQNNMQQEQQVKPQTVFNTNYSQNILNDDLYKEDMLIDAYIGKKADKFKSGGFSWCTFFFGTYYILYRKMWIFGIILWAIGLVIGKVIGTLEWLELIIDLIVGISAACIFKEKYLSHATKKVREIKEKNANKTHEELMVICKKKGGTSILPILLIVGIVLVTTGMELYQNFDSYNKAKDRLDEIKGNETTTPIEITREKLNVTLTAGFEEVTNDSTLYSSIYREYSSNSSCLFYLSTMNANGATSATEKMEIDRSHYEVTNPIEEKKINGNTWAYMSKDNIYFYKIIYNDKIYDIRFTIYSENREKNCSKIHSEILESIKFN